MPAEVQDNIFILMGRLLKFIKAYMHLFYIPLLWTVYNIVLIPNGGKASPTKAKNLRLISLQLKMLKGIIEVHIRLSGSQHKYIKVKSTKLYPQTRLHSIFKRICTTYRERIELGPLTF